MIINQGKAIRTCQQRVQNFSYMNACVYQSLVIRTPRVPIFSYSNAACSKLQLYERRVYEFLVIRTHKITSVFKTLVIQTPHVQNFSYSNAGCPKLQLYKRRVCYFLFIWTRKKGFREEENIYRGDVTLSITQELIKKEK